MDDGRDPLIIANWKMNGSQAKICEDLQAYTTHESANNENVIFAVPYVYLTVAQQNIKLSQHGGAKYKIASQDVSQFCGYGAYTGEVSANMLHDLGIEYTIVGHSERRMCGDTNEIIMQKLHNLLQQNITPIYCIGESLAVRESGEYEGFLLKQLNVFIESLENLKIKVTETAETFENQASMPITQIVPPAVPAIIVAYEPIWSIGTGIIPDAKQIEEIMNLIYAFVQKKLGRVKIAALYGGSVTSKNITEIMQVPLVNGVLVGGASLNVSEFTRICSAAKVKK
jgi:triosephosphate isomerase